MGNMMKVFLILVIVLGLFVLAGCQSQDGEIVDGNSATAPQDNSDEPTQQTTTEKPVNVVEDPLNNGEGDPLDAIDGTTGASGPMIDIEIEETTDTPTTAPNQGGSTGGNNQSGNNQGSTTEPTQGKEEDDLVIDFGDLINGSK